MTRRAAGEGLTTYRAGIHDVSLTFTGVLRCVEPFEYWLWRGGKGEAPAEIVNPLRAFCHDAPIDWCRAERAAGRCCLTDRDFVARVSYVAPEREESPMIVNTRTPRPTPPGPRLEPNGTSPAAIQWEKFRRASRQQRGPSLTITKGGRLTVSAAADELLGKPAAVQLAYAAHPPMIGVVPIDAADPGAFVVRRKEGAAGFSVSCLPFYRQYRISHDATRRLTASMVGEVLAAPLSESS